jgi:dihydroxyacetone kinase
MDNLRSKRKRADQIADKTKIQEAMKTASQDVITSEPDLTKWDTVSLVSLTQHPRRSGTSTKTVADGQIVGDGDCGETCAAGAKAVLEALGTGLGEDGDIVNLFRELTDIIDGQSFHHTSPSAFCQAECQEQRGKKNIRKRKR